MDSTTTLMLLAAGGVVGLFGIYLMHRMDEQMDLMEHWARLNIDAIVDSTNVALNAHKEAIEELQQNVENLESRR
jgi:hypothetical protein